MTTYRCAVRQYAYDGPASVDCSGYSTQPVVYAKRRESGDPIGKHDKNLNIATLYFNLTNWRFLKALLDANDAKITWTTDGGSTVTYSEVSHRY